MPATLADLRARRRAGIDHPVIDSLVHSMEYVPVLEDFIHEVGGTHLVDRFRAARRSGRFQSSLWYDLSPSERARRRVVRPAWWGFPSARTIDLAAVALPALLSERLPECGVDFGIVYGNAATFAVLIDDNDLRAPLCRAVNLYQAELFAPHRERLCPAAAIPLFTPQEGIEELEFAVGELGFRTALISGGATRHEMSEDGRMAAPWFDSFGIDSAFDYAPFWQRAVSLGVPLAVHRGTQGWPGRDSISNYSSNQIGHFATGHEAIVRGLFFGGVTRRFPDIRLSLLEGGAGYGESLLADLASVWRRRGGRFISQYDPGALDMALLFDLIKRYGDRKLCTAVRSPDDLAGEVFGLGEAGQGPARDQEQLDDFAAAGISDESDIARRFIPNFWFGCEADDPPTCFGESHVRAVWATDGGHWDVPDLTGSLDTTWTYVEKGHLSIENFSDLVYRNPVRFFTEANANFFQGTALACASDCQLMRIGGQEAQGSESGVLKPALDSMG
jgi:predicted TIM-barrel fold metal-dependent hydrolase